MPCRKSSLPLRSLQTCGEKTITVQGALMGLEKEGKEPYAFQHDSCRLDHMNKGSNRR